MSDVEQIYALFVEANPVVDPATLPETLPEARPVLHSVPNDPDASDDGSEPISSLKPPAPRISNRRTALVAAAVLIAVIGIAALLSRSSSEEVAPPAMQPGSTSTQAMAPVTAVAQAEAFIGRLDSGDVDGAIELLADAVGSIWFPPLGQVTSTDDVRDYLDFYRAIGTKTALSDCTSQLDGPRTIVICQANQQSEVLAPLGLDFPIFPMQFQVWEDGIRTVEFGPGGTAGMSTAFNVSSFFKFRAEELVPRGLVQDSGDPIWSKANGELMRVLVIEFLANNS